MTECPGSNPSSTHLQPFDIGSVVLTTLRLNVLICKMGTS